MCLVSTGIKLYSSLKLNYPKIFQTRHEFFSDASLHATSIVLTTSECFQVHLEQSASREACKIVDDLRGFLSSFHTEQ